LLRVALLHGFLALDLSKPSPVDANLLVNRLPHILALARVVKRLPDPIDKLQVFGIQVDFLGYFHTVPLKPLTCLARQQARP
jgi:hypothetical protein